MFIVCPGCEHRFQVEPAVIRGKTFRARCSRCERRFDVNVDTGQIVANPATSAPTPRPGTLPTVGRAAAAPTPAPTASRRPAELEEVLREATERYDHLMKSDPFALLGITVESGNQEVMDAYFRLAERYRATRWQGLLDEDESQRLWQVTLRIDEAFNELGDAERRRRSHQMRSGAVERKAKTDLISGPRAALIREQLQADVDFEAGRYEDAKAGFKRCLALAPDRSFFHLRLAQCLMREASFGNTQPDWLAVERALDKALALDPQNLEHLMALGEMWNARGQPSRAMPFYKRVRDIEPHHDGASQAIETYLSGKSPGSTRRTTTERLVKFLKRDR